MRRRSSTALAAAVALGWSLAPVSVPPAAATDTDLILIANRYVSSTCASSNFRLFVFNLATRELTNLGQPPISNLTEFTEAKPIDLNRKILALWGGSAGNKGGVGVYDRAAAAWTKYFALPAAFELPSDGRNAHSITLLPRDPANPGERDHFAIAHTGRLNGTGNGWVVVIDDAGTIKDSEPLDSAHGVEWDPPRNALYAVGESQVRRYSYNVGTKQITFGQSYGLPPKPSNGGPAGGHDLRRRRVADTRGEADSYFVTANEEAWVFDPDTGGLAEIGSNLGGVKSMDQSFDGRTEYNYMNGTEARFLGSTPWVSWGNSCIKPYKAGRFIWDPGQPVYPEDDSSGTPTWSPTFTVGGGANSWWIEVIASSDVVSLDVIGKNGQFFMSNVTKHSWGFGQSPPEEMTAGSLIKLIGRKADGSSAGSITFPWLQDTNPDTEAGWNASFTIHQCNTKLEATISSAAVAAKVRIGTADWATMTKNTSTGRWERSPGVPIGTKYLIRAYLSPGTEAAPQAYDLIRTC